LGSEGSSWNKVHDGARGIENNGGSRSLRQGLTWEVMRREDLHLSRKKHQKKKSDTRSV